MYSLFSDLNENPIKVLKALMVFSQNQNLAIEYILDELYPYIFEINKIRFKNTLHTYLIQDKLIFKNYIDTQIKSGKKLLNLFKKNNVNRTRSSVFLRWDDFNQELLKRSFNIPNNEYLINYPKTEYLYSDKKNIVITEDILNQRLDYLEQIVYKIDLFNISEHSNKVSNQVNSNDIFIVHGHNNELKITVLRTLEKLGLNPIVLHEQPNFGKTIIEKFEKFSNVGFAIVLLTKDDVGGTDKEKLSPRARQNVLFEHGFFVGKIGRERVLALVEENVEIPSDLSGVIYTVIDSKGFWKFELIKEMRSAGYKIDSNDII